MLKLSEKDQSVQGLDEKEERDLDHHVPSLPPPTESKKENPLEVTPIAEGSKGRITRQDPTQREALAEHLLRFEYPTRWKALRLASNLK